MGTLLNVLESLSNQSIVFQLELSHPVFAWHPSPAPDSHTEDQQIILVQT